MSLFDWQRIPESLLSSHYHNDNDASSDFEEDLNTLLSYSLIATDVDGHQFKMHRLVQFTTRKWLALQAELEGWKQKYVMCNETGRSTRLCETELTRGFGQCRLVS
jgi:hypothetical protein